MKIRPVGAELFHADGQTDRQADMTTLTVAFRNFACAPKSCPKERVMWSIFISAEHFGCGFNRNTSAQQAGATCAPKHAAGLMFF